MSTMTVVVTFDLLERAFGLVDVSVPPPQFEQGGAAKAYSRAPEVEAALGDAWLKLKALVERCVTKGREIIQTEIDLFLEYVEQTCDELGSDAKELRDRLLQKVHEMITTTFELMLKSLRSEIFVGERRLSLKKIDLAQKLLFSGSLAVSLTSLCNLAGGGELTVTGSYEFAGG